MSPDVHETVVVREQARTLELGVTSQGRGGSEIIEVLLVETDL